MLFEGVSQRDSRTAIWVNFSSISASIFDDIGALLANAGLPGLSLAVPGLPWSTFGHPGAAPGARESTQELPRAPGKSC